MAIKIIPNGYEGLADGIRSFGEAIGQGFLKRAELQQEKELEEMQAAKEMKKIIQKQRFNLEKSGYRSTDIMPKGGFKPDELNVVKLEDGQGYWKKNSRTPSQKMSMERLAQSAALKDAGGSQMMGITPESQQKYQESLTKYRKFYAQQFSPASTSKSIQNAAPEDNDWADESW